MSVGEEEGEVLLLLLLLSMVIIFHESIPSLYLFALMQDRTFRCLRAEMVLMLDPDMLIINMLSNYTKGTFFSKLSGAQTTPLQQSFHVML